MRASKSDRNTLWRIVMDYYLDREVLYKRTFDGTLLRCMNEKITEKILHEIYEGICATHTNRHIMMIKIQRDGYFWMMIERDCGDYMRKCNKYQVHEDKINAPPVPLFNMVSHWPFAIWGVDVIEPINLKVSNGHKFILVAIDYFTK